ncbi:MAG: hypothetical protein ACYSWU_13840, partial [Planctomycetota bacterium]
TEASFRDIERSLDQLIEKDRSEFAEQDIGVTDESVRSYGYDPLLSWSYRFEGRRAHRGPEIALVTVRISFHEPTDIHSQHNVSLWCRSEIFQEGQLSRWEKTTEDSLPVAEVIARGVAEIVCEKIDKGYAEIDGK